jgi:hypothetical protein
MHHNLADRFQRVCFQIAVIAIVAFVTATVIGHLASGIAGAVVR